MEEWRRFKKGDKVIIKAMATDRAYYHPMDDKNHMGYNSSMHSMAGQEYTITRVMYENHGNIYKLDGGWSWSWTDEFLEPVAPPSNNKEAVILLSMEE